MDAFLAPLRRALSCLGDAHISLDPKGRQPGDTRAWTINDSDGLAVRGWHLDAQMHF